MNSSISKSSASISRRSEAIRSLYGAGIATLFSDWFLDAEQITDLGTQTPPGRSDTGHLLDRLIAAVGVEPFADQRGKPCFVAIEGVDQFQQ